MATLRIFDLTEGGWLACELRDLLRLLAPRSLQATWTISAGHEDFEATGEGGVELERLAQRDSQISGAELAALAEKTHQVIWGKFIGSLPTSPEENWIVIHAFDTTFYEISTLDELVLQKIKSTFADVRPTDDPLE